MNTAPWPLLVLLASLGWAASSGFAQQQRPASQPAPASPAAPAEDRPAKSPTPRPANASNKSNANDEPTATAAAEPARQEEPPKAAKGGSETPAAIPRGDSSGTIGPPRFRRIYFYESHAPRLIPNSFWPVALDDLEAALRREAAPGQPGEERPQLTNAVYVARFDSDALVSDPDASMLDLTYRDDAPGHLSLGPMNLAIHGEAATDGAPAQSARLVTLSDGSVRAIVNQDSRLRFGWSRRGLLGPDGSYSFDLRIPPSGRTRFVVGMPEGMRLESLDGVITTYPSPPQEAHGLSGETELTWYGIEAGGLSRLRLIARPDGPSEAPRRLSVRQLGLDYTAATDGLDWTARIVVDVPRGQSLPQLTVLDGGRITAVRVNREVVRWKETTAAAENPELPPSTVEVADSPANPEAAADPAPAATVPATAADGSPDPTDSRRTRIQVIGPLASPAPGSLPIHFEITGVAPLWDAPDNRQGTLRLPQVVIGNGQPQTALAQTEALLRVRPPLRLIEFIDAERWNIDDLPASEEADPEHRFHITGPPSISLPAVRLAATERWPAANAALRLAVFPGELLARWEAAIQIEGEGPQPLHFEFQPGWQVDRVLLLSSGRIIELPSEAGDSQPLTVWPEASDLVDGVLRIQVTGRRLSLRQGELDTVPATWFTRLRGAVVRCVAAVVPPAEYDWVSGTALRGRRIKNDELSAAFAEMIGPVDGKTLLFDTDNGLTPELEVRQPPPVFSADLHLDLRLEEGQLVEQLRVTCRLPAGRAPRLRVRLGAAGGRPPMQWSLANPQTLPGGSREPFAAERVEGEPREGEVWELSPPGGVRDEWVILGRRQYPLPTAAKASKRPPAKRAANREATAEAAGLGGAVAAATGHNPAGQIVIPLPTVPLTQDPQTASQRATVSIGPRLSLLRTEGPVLRVPKPLATPAKVASEPAQPPSANHSSAAGAPSQPTAAAESSPASTVAEQSVAASQPSPTATAEGWLLRYDASNESLVELRVATSAPAPSVVWDERVEVLAGIGGGDRIRAAYRLDGHQPLELRFDPSMRVVELGGNVVAEKSSDQPGRIELTPREAGGWVYVELWRPSPTPGVLREFHAPQIETSAVVLRRSWRLWSAPDTLSLAASSPGTAPGWMETATATAVTPIEPGETIWLARAGFAWAIGGAVALLVLGLGWWMFRTVPRMAVAPFVGLAIAAALLPVWSEALVGFVLLPMTAAGLLASVWADRESAAGMGDSVAASRRQSSKGPDSRGPDSGGPGKGGPGNGGPGKGGPGDGGLAKRGQPPSAGGRTAAPLELHPTASLGRGSSRLGMVWILAAVSAAAVAHAADPAPSPPAETKFPVMIPVTENGEMAGDRVYIPKTFYDSLFRPTGGQQDLGELQFQSASYQVRVTPSADSSVPDSVVIEATWRVEMESAARLVRLPIDPMVLDRLEVVVDSVPNEIRPRPDGDSVLIRPPRAGLNILRASLSPDVLLTAAGGVCKFELGLPAVARASLSVSSEGPLTGLSLPNCFGRIEEVDAGGRLTASLGPITDFVLLWQHRGGALPRSTEEVQRRWWVQTGSEHMSRELEIEIGDVASAGATIQLSGDTGSEPTVTSPDWMLREVDETESVRGNLRLVSVVESPGPIRLLWTEPHSLRDGGTITLPDIRPEGLVGGLDTIVAVDVPTGWSVAPSSADSGDPAGVNADSGEAATARELAGDAGRSDAAETDAAGAGMEPADFFMLWEGYRGSADRVLRSPTAGEMTVQIVAPPRRPSRASEAHRLVVAGDHLRVSYLATLHTVGQLAHPLRLLLPPEMRLESVRINGEPAAALVVPPTTQVLELLLPQGLLSEPSEIRVVGTLPVGGDKNFAPPRVRLSGVQIEDSRYQMFRGDRLRVRELAAPTEVAEPGAPIDYDLTAGTVPLQSWILSEGNSSRATRLSGRYQITDVSSRFAATTLTTLRWEDGLWTMEATIDVDDFGGSTDFLTVEVPTRWIEGLDVEPAAKWSSQPAIDTATQLIRILPQSTSLRRLGGSSSNPAPRGGLDIRVRISSTLENAGEGGISVPSIRLLGEGPRERYFSPPRRLTNTQIDWQTRNARWASPPKSLLDVAPPPASHLFYEIVGDSFSATLRQADSNSDAARCTLWDVALFPRDADSLLALMRWDLLPGNRDQIEFEIPPGARLLGTWSSGTPTEARAAQSGRRVTVPVGLSRLAQQMVLLAELPIPPQQTELRLPHLVGIPVSRTWVASYDNAIDIHTGEDPSEASSAARGVSQVSLDALLQTERLLSESDPSDGPWQSATADEYRRALATAMMDALNASVDSVAERPTADKRQWLRPWFTRLHELGWPGIEPLTPLDGKGDATDRAEGTAAEAKPNATAPSPDDKAASDKAASDKAASDESVGDKSLSDAAPGDPSAGDSVWAAIDAWAPRFLQRVLGGEFEFESEMAADAPTGSSWWIPPPSWAPTRLISAPGGVHAIPASMAPQQVLHGDPAARGLRVLWLGMLGWMIAAICLRLLGAHYLMRPALWLAIFGLLSITLIPLPLSLAMCGVALASPLMGRR